jgi:hypothetical protein
MNPIHTSWTFTAPAGSAPGWYSLGIVTRTEPRIDG